MEAVFKFSLRSVVSVLLRICYQSLSVFWMFLMEEKEARKYRYHLIYKVNIKLISFVGDFPQWKLATAAALMTTRSLGSIQWALILTPRFVLICECCSFYARTIVSLHSFGLTRSGLNSSKITFEIVTVDESGLRKALYLSCESNITGKNNRFKLWKRYVSTRSTIRGRGFNLISTLYAIDIPKRTLIESLLKLIRYCDHNKRATQWKIWTKFPLLRWFLLGTTFPL